MQGYGIYLFGEDCEYITPETKFWLLKKHGFSSVSIWWSLDYQNTTPLFRLKTALKVGLKIENIHLPFKNVKSLWLEESETSKKYLQELFSALETCKKYEIKKAIMHVSYSNNMPQVNKTALANFKKIAVKAKACGVKIAFENTRSMSHLRYIIDNLSKIGNLEDTIKLCYDNGHNNCFNPQEDILSEFGDKLIDLHLHDNNSFKDEHLLPFKGSYNFAKFCKQLKKLNYRNPLFLEVKCDNLKTKEELEKFIIEAKKSAEKLMQFYKTI